MFTPDELTHVPGLSNRDYHRIKAVSPSQAKYIGRSALHYYDKFRAPDRVKTPPSEAMRVGSALHLLVLEPELFDKQCQVAPDFNRRTNDGKAAAAEFEANAAANDIIVISADSMERVLRMGDALRNHPGAQAVLAETPGLTEQSYTWTDLETGLPCKVRPDWHSVDRKIVADIKTCADASREAMQRQCNNLSYHVQASWNLTALGAEEFYIIAVESERPFAPAVYPLSRAFIAAGTRRVDAGLALLKACQESGEWPGYGDTIQEPLDLPRWNHD